MTPMRIVVLLAAALLLAFLSTFALAAADAIVQSPEAAATATQQDKPPVRAKRPLHGARRRVKPVSRCKCFRQQH